MIVFDDARAAVIATLTAALADRTESYAAGANVSGELEATLPQVVVIGNGVTSRVRGIVQRVTVRITTWCATDVDSHALAQLCAALLDDAGYVTLTGPDDAFDADSDRPFSAITVRASMQGRLTS